MRTAVFTIASRNYFGVVRTLMDSLEKSNPDYERYVCVADEIDTMFAQMPRNYNLLSLEDIELPSRKKMLFRYTILELNTAIKPFVFQAMFQKYGYDRVIYIDPDIYVYKKLTEIDNLLADYDIVLTPHLTGLWHDDKLPDEVAIMQAGAYNLGFLALAKSENTNTMLTWWANKLETLCVVAIEKGIFVDQKWMDLVPGLFEKVYILRHEGYNVAYWNLSHRKVVIKNGEYYFNEDPLVFFHFSGFNPLKSENVSKHQNRFQMSDLEIIRPLFQNYSDAILENDYEMYQKYQYRYNYFNDDKRISDLYRAAYGNEVWLQEKCGDDPFSAHEIFIEYAEKLTPFMMNYVWNRRLDVQAAYPDSRAEAFYNWFVTSGKEEYHLDEAFCRKRKENLPTMLNAPTMEMSDEERFHRRVMAIKRFFPKSLYCAGRDVYRFFSGHKAVNSIMTLEDGIQLVGYIRSEHGVGEAARHMAKALEKMEIPWCIYDFEEGNLSRQKDTTWDYKIENRIKYKILILNINADQIPAAKAHFPEEIWNNTYKIGVWFWELPEFPDEWLEAFNLVDEVWAPTRFIEQSLREKATCPVVYMPLEMSLNEPKQFSRAEFGLPEEAFLFLNMYDTLSIASRKNPEASIRAFKESFAAEDLTVGLVIKINNSQMAEEKEKLEQLKGAYKNIYFITEILSRNKVNELICCCDVAVSLHRSEGLGLLCQEAMYFGKPVIATNWSGNVDFMDNSNSCLVDYELKEIGTDIGPYKAHQKWADADIDMASEYMKRLKNDVDYYNKISGKAKQDIRQRYSAEKCARLMKHRLDKRQL